jgi:hypothetical protein
MIITFNSEAYGLHWGMIPTPARKPVHEPEVQRAIAAYEKRKFEAGMFTNPHTYK